MNKSTSWGLAVTLLLSASASATTLARQNGAFGIVTYDPVTVVIESVADWNAFSAAVADGSLATEGVIVRLSNDVGPVSTTVGTAAHPFAGVFDGGSNTLTVALSGSDRAIAPFFRISGATIRNLKVEGTVSGAIHCSGLVGEVFGGTNLIEGCEVAAAITCSASHFGGFIGHGGTYAATLRGCVFSGSLSGGTYVATFNGWSDDGAATTLVDCLDASGSAQPLGRGTDAACVSNTLYLASKDFSNRERLWSEGNRGRRAYAVTGDEGVVLDFGEPLRTYGGSGLSSFGDLLRYEGDYRCAAGRTFEIGFAEDIGYVRSFRVEDADGNDVTATALSGTTVTMPDGAVTIMIVQTDTIDPAHFSRDGDVFAIHSSAGWAVFCDLLNGGSEDFAGKTVRLGADIAVSRTAGTADHPFRGTFDGCGHTMHLAIADSENQGTAPFRHVADATVRFLRTTGRVTGGMHCAGLVGFATGAANLVRNCDVLATVLCAGERHSHGGGILGHGHASATTLRDCRFAGTIVRRTAANARPARPNPVPIPRQKTPP